MSALQVIICVSPENAAQTDCPASNADTPIVDIEHKFKELIKRTDIAILLINQHVRSCPCSSTTGRICSAVLLLAPQVLHLDLTRAGLGCWLQIADEIEGLILAHEQPVPTIVIIPSKEHA